ncbi:hypothetical protein EGW08_014657, partial [Elysia chlorotica]
HVLGVDVGVALQQELHDGQVALLGRDVQGRAVNLGACVSTDPCSEQDLGCVLVPKLGRKVQRRYLTTSDPHPVCGERRPVRHKRPNRVGLASLGGLQQALAQVDE